VWLQRENGERWVVAYRAYGYWTPFDGLRVTVEGERYAPSGQSIGAQHFRVGTLRVTDPKAAKTFAAVGPERTYRGSFGTMTGEKGSKSEGETWAIFSASDGARYELANPPHGVHPIGTIEITAREIEWSPFVARRGSRSLWVIDVRWP
jgi:hypothetical protein